jgi:hypothetical protein
LAGVPRGLFSRGAALDRIQRAVNGVRHDLGFLDDLQRFGLKIAPRLYHYPRALFAIQEYNPALAFRGRDPEEVEGELDHSLDYILKVSERVRKRWTNFTRRIRGIYPS